MAPGGRYKKMPLTEAVTLQRGFDLPMSQRKTGRHPVVASTGITSFHEKAKVKGPGVTIGRSGSIGGGQYINDDFWPLNTTLWVKDFKGNHPKFIYYLLRSLDFSSFNAGAAVPTLNRNHLAALEVAVPDIPLQKKIADTLGSLDEKIELNRHMNETLEQIGQALFRHYFADNPGVKKWDEASIYEFADVLYGAPFSSKMFNENKEGKPLIRIRDLKSQTPGFWTTEVHKKGVLVKPGDILVGMDAEFHPVVWAADEAWMNQRVCQFAPKSGVSSVFVFEAIKPWLGFFERGKIGTTVIHLGKADIDKITIKMPDETAMINYSVVAQPIYDLKVKKMLETQSIIALRDSILPKLISGDIKP